VRSRSDPRIRRSEHGGASIRGAAEGVLRAGAQRDADLAVEAEGAAATLTEMHDHSSERFLIAHQGFSKMMESFVDEGLVDYDVNTRTATLSAAGRQFIA
jgi:hypothetical protein